MTATETVTNAQLENLARTIRAALETSSAAGYAASSFVHDHHTDEAILRMRQRNARTEADRAVRELWSSFYALGTEL